jgi:hypothetical protein
MVIVHVGDVETTGLRVLALIVEPDRAARKRDIHDWAQDG